MAFKGRDIRPIVTIPTASQPATGAQFARNTILSMLLVLLFKPSSLSEAGFEGRDEIEDPLHDALVEAGIGEVSGGGGGIYGSNIDVEVDDPNDVPGAIALIRQVLIGLNAPTSATIRDDDGNVYRVQE
jgi:hypothetical protein